MLDYATVDGMDTDVDGRTGTTDGDTFTTTRRLTRIFIGLGLLVMVAVIGLPLWASLTYRSAVHDLHDELAAIEIESGNVVDVRIEKCWNDLGPASVRVLVPNGDTSLSDVVSDYVDELAALGFVDQGGVTGVVAARPRSDALDEDMITVSIDDDSGRITLTADPFDADMVTCLPF